MLSLVTMILRQTTRAIILLCTRLVKHRGARPLGADLRWLRRQILLFVAALIVDCLHVLIWLGGLATLLVC